MLTKPSLPENINFVSKKYSIIQSAKANVVNTNQSVLILNVCNNMNTFGAGFNKIIAEEFPIVKENYHLLGAGALKNKLGYTQFVPAFTNNKHKNQIIVANMICQTGIMSSSNPRPLNYYYFAMCLAKIQENAKQYQQENDLNLIIYMPKIHMGVTGANWHTIYELIVDIVKKPIHVVIYE